MYIPGIISWTHKEKKEIAKKKKKNPHVFCRKNFFIRYNFLKLSRKKKLQEFFSCLTKTRDKMVSAIKNSHMPC